MIAATGSDDGRGQGASREAGVSIVTPPKKSEGLSERCLGQGSPCNIRCGSSPVLGIRMGLIRLLSEGDVPQVADIHVRVMKTADRSSPVLRAELRASH